MSEVTKRDYLVKLGLAKAGVVGRFSNEAKAALAKAEAEGMVFADNKPAPAAPRVAREGQANVPALDVSGVDFKAVRSWAAKNGIALGARGRIPTPILAQYLGATGGTAPKPTPAVVPPRSEVRSESVAWGHAPRPEGAPAHTSEPIVAIQNCGRCAEAVKYCRCSSGPYMPSYLGGAQASLVRPTV